MPAPSCRTILVTVLSCVLLIGSAIAAQPVSFQTPPAPYLVGQGPLFVVAANLRPGFPGRRDLIVSNPNVEGNNTPGSTITILLNDGTGVYTQAPGSPITVGIAPIGIAVGDFGNGNPDLAVANAGGNSISILIGNGDGTFKPPTTITAGIGSSPIGVFTADLNHDGKLDLVVTNSDFFNKTTPCSGSSISVLLGNGIGGFSPAAGSPLTSGPCPTDAAIVDLGNGQLDLVVANNGGMNSMTPGTVSVFIGKGNGTFNPKVDYAVGVQPMGLTVADFGNGKMDVAVGDSGDMHSNTPGTDPGGISFLVGNGNGTLQAATFLNDVPGVFSLVGADVDGDGKNDLVLLGHNGGLTVMRGTGDVTDPFLAPTTYAVSGREGFVGVGDLNGDGHPDAVVPNGKSNTITVLLNQGNGTFPAPVAYPVGVGPQTLAIGRLRQATFAPVDIVTGNGNFCGNGQTQLTCTAPNLSILLSGGDGTFIPVNGVSTLPATSTSGVAIADFNGDGKADLVEVENVNCSTNCTGAVRVVPGNGDGTFGGAINISANQNQNPSGVAVADFDGDSKVDFVATNFQGTLGLALNQGTPGNPITSNTFPTVNSYGSNSGFPFNVIAAKLDGSTTLPDIAFTQSTQFCNQPCTQTDAVGVLLNQGAGVFSGTQFNLTAGTFPRGLVAGRFNNAGGPGLDLAVANAGSNNISIFLNNGDSTGIISPLGIGPNLTADHTYPVGSGTSPQSIAMGDFNNDGNLDLVVANAGSNNCNNSCPPNTVSIFLGIGDGTFTLAKEYVVSGSPSAVGVADVNGDGFPDIVVADQNGNAVTILLNTGGSRVTLTASPNPSAFGQPVTLTAKVAPTLGNGAATGTVTFLDNGVSIGSGLITSGTATLTTGALAVGAHSITAQYSGDANFDGVLSHPLQQIVGKAGTTLMITGASADPTVTATPVTFTATLTSNSGGGIASVNGETVNFKEGATLLGSGLLNASGMVTSSAITFSTAGIHTITAVYGGDSNFNGFTSPPFDETVDASGTTVTTTAITSVAVSQPTPGEKPNAVHLKQTVSFTVQVSTAAGNPSGSVALQDNNEILGSQPLPGNSNTQTVNFGPFTFSVGEHNITASYFGDNTFKASTGTTVVEHTPRPR